jgi:lysyl-tRNA synthetase class 2
MYEAIKAHTGYNISGKNENELRGICNSLEVKTDPTMGKGKLIDAIFGEKCEHHYVQPTFIIDYPIEMSPLTKKHRNNPELTERFELIINGKELANAYSELNDPIDQRERFEDQLRLSEKGDNEAMFIDQDFLRALEYGMPPTSGMGMGIDRLTMFMTNSPSIQDVLFFPQMKPEARKKPEITSSNDEYLSLGIPEEWIGPLKSLGYTTVEKLKAVDKPGKLHTEMMGFRKKNKLDITTLTVDELKNWIG